MRRKRLITSNVGLGIDSPKIQLLTVKIRELKKTLFRDAVETVVEIGEYLWEAKASLSHGDWSKWLAQEVHFSDRTAENYMNLTKLSRSNPKTFSDLKDAGIAKLYKIALLPQPTRKKLLLRKRFPIPGRAAKKTIFEMSHIEFYRVVKRLTRPSPAKIPPDLQARRISRLVSRTTDLLQDLAKHADEISPNQKALLTEKFKLLARSVEKLDL